MSREKSPPLIFFWTLQFTFCYKQIRTTLSVIKTQTYQNSNKTQTFKVSLDIDGVKVNPKFTVKSKSYGEFGL